MGSKSCHMIPLTIDSFRGGHTNTDIDTDIDTDRDTHIYTCQGQNEFV